MDEATRSNRRSRQAACGHAHAAAMATSSNELAREPLATSRGSSTRTGALLPEVCRDEMSVGMTKFYMVACFTEICGFVRQVMWDGINCHRAACSAGLPRASISSRSASSTAPSGRQPEGHLDRAASGRVRTVLYGHLAPLLPDACYQSTAGPPDADRQRLMLWATSGAGSRACRATTTWSSNVSSDPTNTHACAWESGPPRPF
jgi:hypothetical protein